MPQGTVKLFKTDQGYGFIAPDERGGADVYIHVGELEKAGLSSLSPGEKVTFDVDPDRKPGRLRAVNVRIAE